MYTFISMLLLFYDILSFLLFSRNLHEHHFRSFNEKVVEGIGAAHVDLFVVLRPLNQGSACSTAHAMWKNIVQCVESSVVTSVSERSAAPPAGVSRLIPASPPFSRQWLSSGGWNDFENTSAGYPSGFYQWQPLQLAFMLMLAHERVLMNRYSWIVRWRTDASVPSVFPSAADWSVSLSIDKAYIVRTMKQLIETC